MTIEKLNNKKFKILDCTLRDGGYYNNWNFSIKLIQDYLNIILDQKLFYNITCYEWIIIFLVIYFIIDNIIDIIIIIRRKNENNYK